MLVLAPLRAISPSRSGAITIGAVALLLVSTVTGRPVFGTGASSGQGLGTGWTRPIDLGSASSSRAIALDQQGNVLIAGYVPSGPTAADAFVRKYDSAGQMVWTREFGSSHTTEARGIAVDARGDVYVVGGVEGALAGLMRSGFTDVFVRKYDVAGNEVWTRQFGASRDAVAYGVALDEDGSVLVVGFTNGALPGQPRYAYRDAYLRKYDSDGVELWTRQFGSSEPTEARAVAADSKGQIYVVGTTLGDLTGQVDHNAGDAFVRAFAPDGAELWTREFGSTAPDVATAAAALASGGVYVSGYGQGNGGAFLRMFTANGDELWVRELGNGHQPTGISVDGSGLVYVAGQVTDGSDDQSTVAAAPFVAAYDSAGNSLPSRSVGSAGKAVWGIATGPDGGIDITGDSTTGTPERPASGFVTRLPE
jgi:hypothetical protein